MWEMAPGSARAKHNSKPSGPRRRRDVFGLASQAEMYLSRSLEEFHRSANAPDLWVPVDAMHRESILESAQAGLTARNRRLHFLRSTILFAALSAEAFANELLGELLMPADADAIDRLPTPEKLLLGIRAAGLEPPLDRGSEPFQSLVLLFSTRNRLVHPRPQGGLAAWIQDVEDAEEAALGPRAALRSLMSVAEVSATCNEFRKHPRLHAGLARTIVRFRKLVEGYQALDASIMDVPPRDALGRPGLYDQMMEFVAKARQDRPGSTPKNA